jgi:predicted RNA binding protein YcfA (HicA-like mRNA interferase family)
VPEYISIGWFGTYRNVTKPAISPSPPHRRYRSLHRPHPHAAWHETETMATTATFRCLALGGRAHGSTGSHLHFKHPIKRGKVTVPHPKHDLPIKTLKSIEKQSGVRLT